MRIRKKSQIVTILTLIIALVFLFIVITINMGKVSQKKTVIDNACDGAGLLLASGLGSVGNALKQEIELWGDSTKNCDWNWLRIIAIGAIILGIVGAVFSGGSSLVLLAAGITAVGGAAIVAADVLFVAYTEPGLLREMEAKYQNMTAEQRLFEASIQYALFSTIDDPAFVADRFDVDRDGRTAGDKIPRFNHWYFQRLNSLPRIGELIERFYRYLFTSTDPGPPMFEIVKDATGWVAKEAYLLSVDPATGQRFRVGDWLRDDFWPFMHELWCYGYGVDFARDAQNGPCGGGGPGPGPGDGDWAWPTNPTGVITSYFGPGHPPGGIDIAAGRGTSILASQGGRVITAVYSPANCRTCSYGSYIIINHGLIDGKFYTSLYGHLQGNPRGLLGRNVSKGQKIGEMGNSGHTEPPSSASCPDCGVHLHFEIRENGRQVDPLLYLSGGGGGGGGGGGSGCGAGSPDIKIEDAQDEVGKLYKEIREFENFIKGLWGLSMDEQIAGFEEWYSQFYHREAGDVDDEDDQTWWELMFEVWIPQLNRWRNLLDQREREVIACMRGCGSRPYGCWSDNCQGGPACDWVLCNPYCCGPDPANPCTDTCWNRCPVKWTGCCGPWTDCCATCGTPCPPTKQCNTPTGGTKFCCDSACCLKQGDSCSTEITRIRAYRDKLNAFANRLAFFCDKILEIYLEAKNLKSDPWIRQAIYVWKDTVLNDLGAEVTPEEPAHMVYVKLDIPSDFKFPYVTQKREWLGFKKCTYVEKSRGYFDITVARYDEDIAKSGPLSNFWRFKFRRGGASEAGTVGTLRTAANRFANLLNGGNATYLSNLMDLGEFNTLANLAYNQGVVAKVRVRYGPGFTYHPGEVGEASKRNKDIYIERRIR